MCTRINVDLYLQAFPLLPNLLHMCSRPRVFRLRFFTRPRIWVTFQFTSAHLAYFVFLFCCGHFSGVAAYLGYVLFDVQPGPGTPAGSDLFSDASTLTNRPQICRGSSLRSIISVSIFSFQRSGKCAATCSKSTATWRSPSFYPRAVDRQSFILRKFMYL